MLKKIVFSTCVLLSGCSTVGTIAKGSFISVAKMYSVQPQAIRDEYPHYLKQTFYTSELLTTDYEKWKVRLVLSKDISEFLKYNSVKTKLEYSLDGQGFSKEVELIYQSMAIQDDGKFTFDFSFSEEGRELWLDYNSSLFKIERPWFNYPISPELPMEIKSLVHDVQYNYAPSWGYLSLRQFMDLFKLNNDKRWEEFCTWQTYKYDDSSVCGTVRIED